MKTIEEIAHTAAWQIFEELGMSKHSVVRMEEIIAERLTEQKEHDIKALSKVYADLLSAKGYDIGTINSELVRLQKEIKDMDTSYEKYLQEKALLEAYGHTSVITYEEWKQIKEDKQSGRI